MNKLRLILLPFSWCYGIITWIRNWLYNIGILKTYSIPGKSILVGNLSTGGTGKTPLVDFILKQFIQQEIPTTSLSRGYGRKTKGLVLASNTSMSEDIGDEPLLYKKHYGDKLEVLVAEKRAEGAKFIEKNFPHNELIVLDDAFQHRAIKAGLNLIVSDYNKMYTQDFVLPAGNLREWKIGAKRADILLVSKCPEELSSMQKDKILKKLHFDPSNVYFSSIKYGPLKAFNTDSILKTKNILLVTGIGNPSPLIQHLTKTATVEHLHFNDHHDFTTEEIEKIHEKFDTFASRDKIIVTTEKDYMRLMNFDSVCNASYPWFYQPIELAIERAEEFVKQLNSYFEKN